MYTLAIENSSIGSYFTEKVTDPILRNCVPIYFGAPNLSDYLPQGSFIQLPDLTLDAVMKTLSDLSIDDYQSRLEAVREAQYIFSRELRLCCWLSKELGQAPKKPLSLLLGLGLFELVSNARFSVGRLLGH
jgi:hypothetical protein